MNKQQCLINWKVELFQHDQNGNDAKYPEDSEETEFLDKIGFG